MAKGLDFEVVDNSKERKVEETTPSSQPRYKNEFLNRLDESADSLQERFDTLEARLAKHRPKFDSVFERAAVWVGVNMAGIITGNNLLNYVSSTASQWNGQYSEGVAMLVTQLGLFTAAAYANLKLIPKINKSIKKAYAKKIEAGVSAGKLSLAKTLTIAGVLAITTQTTPFKWSVENYKYDAKDFILAWERSEGTDNKLFEETYFSKQELVYDNTKLAARKDNAKLFDPMEFVQYSRKSTEGRFLRTFRWHDHIRKAEIKYEIPQGLLAGLIMRESYGNPFEVSDVSDGGVGVLMFQPGTAAEDLGLHVGDHSRATGADRHHHKRVVEKLEDCEWDYECIIKYDERFDIVKAIDAGARYLKERKERFDTDWIGAISAYNRGSPAKNPFKTSHVQHVLFFQKEYLKRGREYGEEVDKEYLRSLERTRQSTFEDLDEVNSKGLSVLKYIIEPGDNRTFIANKFNEWDSIYNNNEFKEVDAATVVNVEGKHERILRVGRDAYIVVDKK